MTAGSRVPSFVKMFNWDFMRTVPNGALLRTAVTSVFLALVGCMSPRLMTVDDLALLERAAPGVRISYGEDPLQYGELLIPRNGTGRFPAVIWIHGGCWLAPFTISHSRALAQALVAEGYAVWNLEYRRVGDTGGGWPNTFLDVARGADHLRVLATTYPIDLSRVIVGGHSAGGQLALWLAGRAKIETGSEVYTADPLMPTAILALAPGAGLSALQHKQTCGGVVDKLVGGAPQDFPERFAAVEPERLLPLRVPQSILVGRHDDLTWLGTAYFEAARARGEGQIRLIELPASGHFEMINPASSTWPLVRGALRSLQPPTESGHGR